MLSHFTTESCLAHGGVTTGCPCHLSATQADSQSDPSSAPAPARPLLLGILAGIPLLGALVPPQELWLFLGCCSSSFSGIFSSGAALGKQGENHSRICLGAPAGMRSPSAASLLMCCKREPPKHQQIPQHWSGNAGNRSSWCNISPLCPLEAFPSAPDTPAALQGIGNCYQHFY